MARRYTNHSETRNALPKRWQHHHYAADPKGMPAAKTLRLYDQSLKGPNTTMTKHAGRERYRMQGYGHEYLEADEGQELRLTQLHDTMSTHTAPHGHRRTMPSNDVDRGGLLVDTTENDQP